MQNINNLKASKSHFLTQQRFVQKPKPRNIGRLFCQFGVVGLLLLFVSTINIVIEIPDDFSILKSRVVKSTPFKHLRNDLQFDIPSEQYYNSPQFNMPDIEAERKDWHNYEAMAADKKRVGPGEQGRPTVNTDESMKELEKQYIRENHFNGYLSNIISVNRSLPSLKLKKCLTKRYLAKLPVVSVVIPCRNELYSVLQRSLHSIVNRTPPELLKEIIVVDDNSHRGYSVSEMMLYAERHFGNLVKFIKFPVRKGLMHARTAGAKLATGDVIVFLDSHIECNHNWLPPLLEPIAINDRITTTPVIDNTLFTTFEYKFFETTRGGFGDWTLGHIEHDVLRGPNIDESKPFKDAIMQGGLFAISRRFFWHLGGYDLGLDTWGSENAELSLKIWMCGGMLLTVPCSHVGHIWIVPHSNKVSPTDPESMARNMKRVIEVWTDEYKDYFYTAVPELEKLDPGNLSEQHALRKRLKCKPFKWFLEFVAPDFLSDRPYDLPPDFANGTVQSLAFPTHCLDTLGQEPVANVGLYSCAQNHSMPHINQLWNFNVYQEIKNFGRNICLDMFHTPPDAIVSLHACTRAGGNQFWHYDKKTKLLVHRENGKMCLEAIQREESFRVVVNKCDENNKQMKWTFGFVNTEKASLKSLTKPTQDETQPATLRQLPLLSTLKEV